MTSKWKAAIGVLAVSGVMMIAGSAALAVTPCPLGKTCGLTQQDGTVLTGNKVVMIGKSSSVATVCGASQVVQGIVVVAPGGGQAAVLATAAKSTEDNPGTRVTVEIEYPNDCVDASSGIAYKQWQGTAQ